MCDASVSISLKLSMLSIITFYVLNLLVLKLPFSIMQWLLLFLSDRTQQIKLGGKLSSSRPINRGTVQGSGAGPAKSHEPTVVGSSVVRPVLPLNGRYPTFGVCETQTGEPVSFIPDMSDYVTQPDTDTSWWIFCESGLAPVDTQHIQPQCF